MGRAISAELQDAIDDGTVYLQYLVEFEIAGGLTLNYCDGPSNQSWNGKTWLADGTLQGPFNIPESKDSRGSGQVSFTLSGETAAMISAMFNSFQQNKRCRIYIAPVTSANVLRGTPYLHWVGRLEEAELQRGEKQSTIKLTYEHILSDITTAREFRWNHATQQIIFPGDKGFEYVEELASEFQGFWGQLRERKKKRKGKDGKGKKK